MTVLLHRCRATAVAHAFRLARTGYGPAPSSRPASLLTPATWTETETSIMRMPTSWFGRFASTSTSTTTTTATAIAADHHLPLSTAATGGRATTDTPTPPPTTDGAHGLPDISPVVEQCPAAVPDAAAGAVVDVLQVHHLGDLKQARLASSWTPVGWVQQALEAIHVTTGLPWWASIVVVTVALRAGLTPLMVKLLRTSAIMHNLRPETDKINAQMTVARGSHDRQALYQCAHQLQQVYKRAGVNPLSALAMPLLQAPIMFSFFMAIRKIADVGLPSFQHGGALWFSDLSVPDPLYALPVIASVTFLTNIRINAETGVSNPQADKMKLFFQIATVAAIPFTAMMPAGVFVYWITSSVWTLGQAMILKRPDIRKRLNLPQLITITPPDQVGAPKQLGFLESFSMAYKAGREAGVGVVNVTNGGGTNPAPASLMATSVAISSRSAAAGGSNKKKVTNRKAKRQYHLLLHPSRLGGDGKEA